ncbi:LytTR family transcriptional regulator [Maribacter algarum]|uniref:LytTR family transcriptional regulator n=1 Tax=Maribacter algarum (ex Zhang et al. 2020) TaxID=2578118 RepID=A0A5S3PSH2_9FLAO|nr:LytTR family DNA-binding domain-containing protein [Maribacter algarum]TMM57893.1 LytTR family transcriptional regulator [Maribacter algarum]
MILASKRITSGSNQYLLLIGIVLLSVVVTRDIIHSSIKDYSFYLSESLLFSTFWLLFIPLTVVCKREAKKRFNITLPVILSILQLTAFSLFVFSVSTLFFEDSFEFYRTLINTTSKYGLVCVLFYGFCNFLFVNDKSILEKGTYQKTKRKIKVNKKGKAILLDCDEIIYVKSDKPYIALITKDRTYLHKCSLKTFLREYATKNFLQVHKSVIVNTEDVVSYTSRKNGDYDLYLTNEHLVRVSRNYSRNFKSFFENIRLE